MLRFTKITLIGTVALWGFIGATHNILDWGGTLGAVTAATSMSTFEGGAESWQATSNSVVVWLGALFIMLSKVTAAAFCAVGAGRMWSARGADAGTFNAAKELALAGCAIAVIMLFGGFIVIGESWFELWRSDVLRGPVLDGAFRYAGLIALIALFVAAKDE
jgi:predicted small integral membrane protein